MNFYYQKIKLIECGQEYITKIGDMKKRNEKKAFKRN